MVEKKKTVKSDICLLLFIIFPAVVFFIGLALFSSNGKSVTVKVDGKFVSEYSLMEDGKYTIEGVDGSTNLLIIEDGKAYVGEASCPDGLCVSQGKVSKNGQSIVCLPNRVVVEVSDDKQSDSNKDAGKGDIDAVAK